MPDSRNIIVAISPCVELLDATGPVEVLTAASRLLGPAGHGYDVRLAARELGAVGTAGGARLVADITWAEVGQSDIDTLIVPGAMRFAANGVEPVLDAELVSWVGSMAAPGPVHRRRLRRRSCPRGRRPVVPAPARTVTH